MPTENLIFGVGLASAAVVSLASSVLVDFATIPRAPLQPQSVAFSIWGLLYALLGTKALTTALARAPVDPVPVLAATISLVLTSAWAFCVRAFSGTTMASTLMLTVSAAFAWTAAALAGKAVVVDPAYELYAGWLAVACTLSVRLTDLRIASVIVAAASVAAARPLTVLPLLWAILLQPESTPFTSSAFVIAAVGGAASIARRLVAPF